MPYGLDIQSRLVSLLCEDKQVDSWNLLLSSINVKIPCTPKGCFQMYLWFIFTNIGFIYIFHMCLIHYRNYSRDKMLWREVFTVSYSRRVKLAPLIPNFSPNPQGPLYCLLLRSTFSAFMDEVLQIFPCLLTVDKRCLCIPYHSSHLASHGVIDLSLHNAWALLFHCILVLCMFSVACNVSSFLCQEELFRTESGLLGMIDRRGMCSADWLSVGWTGSQLSVGRRWVAGNWRQCKWFLFVALWMIWAYTSV